MCIRDRNQGLAVIASSNIILLVVFSGVLVLQAGLWYTNWEYQQRLKTFYSEDAKESKDGKKQAVQDQKDSKKKK